MMKHCFVVHFLLHFFHENLQFVTIELKPEFVRIVDFSDEYLYRRSAYDGVGNSHSGQLAAVTAYKLLDAKQEDWIVLK